MSEAPSGSVNQGIQNPLSPGATSSDVSHRMLEAPSAKWERAWVWASEQINPIVVKEVRQSLKSRQFTISFGLTLVAAVGWTLLAISLSIPRIYYLPGGTILLAGYFCILVVPLMVVIPFSAFRSLTSETEDSTFELLSISALSASQIVSGKMASALVQIVLYLSALAPCIVLTYLLRGLSLFSILFILGLTVTYSISETALALLFASISRSRMVQNGVSVLILAGLLFAGFGWTALLIGEGFDEFANPPREVYLVLFAVATILVLVISLVLNAAAAAIDFPSENHSTPIRLRILVIYCAIVFWALMGVVAAQEAEAAVALLTFLFILTMVLGGLITGEYGVISPRAQRSLPKTFFGRVFLTWLYPGAGLGYVFIVSLFAGIFVTLGVMELYYSSTVNNWFSRESVLVAGYFFLCYVMIYLGINRLVLLAIPKSVPSRMVGAVALLAVGALFVHLVPFVSAFYLNDYRSFPYDWHQAFNVPWTITETLRSGGLGGSLGIFSNEIGVSLVIVTLCAIAVFGLNLILCTKDVLLVRISRPPRVVEEEESETPAEQPVIDPFGPDEDD